MNNNEKIQDSVQKFKKEKNIVVKLLPSFNHSEILNYEPK